MALKKATPPKLALVGGTQRRRNQVNLFDLAYDRIESLIVQGDLRPGQFLAMQDLQAMTGLGRTPVHQAVSRLAVDTLVTIRPRHGVQIAPIDLARERVLLRLRRDVERFVIQLATERAGPAHRNQMMHLIHHLRDRRETLSIEEFNKLDRRIDRLIGLAAAEPFLDNTLRPLHSIFRRIGWLFHTHLAEGTEIDRTIDVHLAVLSAVAHRRADEAMAASDELMGFVAGMFDVLEARIDPALLDASLTPLTTI